MRSDCGRYIQFFPHTKTKFTSLSIARGARSCLNRSSGRNSEREIEIKNWWNAKNRIRSNLFGREFQLEHIEMTKTFRIAKRRQTHKSLSFWAVTNNRKSNIKKGIINNESASWAFHHVFASIRKTHTTNTCRKIINISHCYLIYETVCINDFRVSATLVPGIDLNLCLLFFIQIYILIMAHIPRTHKHKRTH